MAGKSSGKAYIEKHTEEIAAKIAEQFGVRIYDVDYTRQGQDYSLDIYIDKDGGVNIGDCENISRLISDELDREDYISEAYTLVVSSPGLGRKLTKDRHLAYSIGEEVEIKLYKPLEPKGPKDYDGILKEFDETTLTVEMQDTTLQFERKNIASIRLALDF